MNLRHNFPYLYTIFSSVSSPSHSNSSHHYSMGLFMMPTRLLLLISSVVSYFFIRLLQCFINLHVYISAIDSHKCRHCGNAFHFLHSLVLCIDHNNNTKCFHIHSDDMHDHVYPKEQDIPSWSMPFVNENMETGISCTLPPCTHHDFYIVSGSLPGYHRERVQRSRGLM